MLSNEEYAYFRELKEELTAQKDLVSMYSRALKESQDTIDALVKEKEEAEEKADDLASSVSDMMTDNNAYVSELQGQIASLKKELEARDKSEEEYDERIQELEDEKYLLEEGNRVLRYNIKSALYGFHYTCRNCSKCDFFKTTEGILLDAMEETKRTNK